MEDLLENLSQEAINCKAFAVHKAAIDAQGLTESIVITYALDYSTYSLLKLILSLSPQDYSNVNSVTRGIQLIPFEPDVFTLSN